MTEEKPQIVYVKTKDLIDKTFTIEDVKPRTYQLWDDTKGAYLKSDTMVKGYSPVWPIKTDLGYWYASYSQLAQLLIAVEKCGFAEILEKKFSCDSNGQSGKDTRYYLNLVVGTTY